MSVLVSVGTDKHPFDRLVSWADALDRLPGFACLVQYGSSRPPEVAEGVAFLDAEALQLRMAQADVVVSHGGPATILEARSQGHKPVCVPRDPDLGEHVDDHQLRFARWMHAKGLVELCEDHDSFRTSLLAADSPARHPGGTLAPSSPEGLAELVKVMHEVTRPRRARRRLP